MECQSCLYVIIPSMHEYSFPSEEENLPLDAALENGYDMLLHIVSETRQGRKLRQQILLEPDLSLEESTKLYHNSLGKVSSVVTSVTELQPEALLYRGRTTAGQYHPTEGWIKLDGTRTPSQKLLTLFHETAHSFMNLAHKSVLHQNREEVRAYTVGVLVGQCFGLGGVEIIKDINEIVAKAHYSTKYAREILQGDRELILYTAKNIILLLDK